MRKRSTIIAFLISLPFFSIGTLPAVSANDETPRALVNCKTAEAIPCIESFQIKTQNGEILNAKLTGRKAPQESDFLGTGYEEYSLDGINFEGTSKNLLIPQIVYYPFGPNKGREFLQIGVMPSWLNQDAAPNENIVELICQTDLLA